MTEKKDLDIDFLLALLQATGVSSYEKKPSKLFRSYLVPYAESIKNDMMGNTLVSLNSKGKYQILLSAHIDEIGMQVTEYCENGLLKLRKIGGINPLHLIGQEVVISSDKGVCYGVIVAKTPNNNNTIPDIGDCFIDVCCHSKQDAEQLVNIGDFVTFRPNARIWEGTIVSKAVDNRVGVFILSQVLRQLTGKLNHITLSVAATTQEEIGLRGMAILAQQLTPDICINIDVTDACQINKDQLPVMGKGCVYYRNADSNPILRQMLISIAQQANIPMQMAVGRHITGGTDSSRIQLFSPHTAVMDLSIPCKYMHTHHEQCSVEDVYFCIALLEAFILHLDNNFPNSVPLLTF